MNSLKSLNRVCIIVMDSVGIGELPDAASYGDAGSHTLANVAKAVGGLKLPHFEKMGLGNISDIHGVSKNPSPIAFHGKMKEASNGKDTTTGHWEMAGIITDHPFQTFENNGFPIELMDAFVTQSGYQTLGNIAASGTEIIQALGAEHVQTKKLIVYTSADSVFQIAAHEDIVPLSELYRLCAIARKLCDPYHIARVIARPFKGDSVTGFYRTKGRKDVSIALPHDTILNMCETIGKKVTGIGKIGNIFDHSGISHSIDSAKTNDECVDATIAELKSGKSDVIFTNLVDFDMLYGHRNDVVGYAAALEKLDSQLPAIWDAMSDGDLLLMTADHGCDPTRPGTDHTREYVPILMMNKKMTQGQSLGVRDTFADIGATVAKVFGIPEYKVGKSLL